MSASQPIALTREQAEALRAALNQFDAQNPTVENTFDPNKPPKEQYIHQAYPKMLYGHDGKLKGRVITVKSAEEEDAALEQGYLADPHPAHDYSRINRNGMRAPEHEDLGEANESDEAEAAAAVEAADKKAKALKKAGKSKAVPEPEAEAE